MIEEPILRVENMNKIYGQTCIHCQGKPENLKRNLCPKCLTVYACRDINFNLYPGEILGIVGESGSGKSTLMQSLYFDQDVSSGEYYLSDYMEGKENLYKVDQYKQKQIRNNYLGMVYQNPIQGLRMEFSSISNISEKMIAAGNRNVKQMIDRGMDLLAKVDISYLRAKEPPKNFSGGMQQRVQIAKALSNNPPVLLLDEVTTGLDLSVQSDVLDLIKSIQRDLKISMIIVSHDLAVIRMLADRTLVMHSGIIIEQGLTDQIMEDPQDPFTQKLVYSLI